MNFLRLFQSSTSDDLLGGRYKLIGKLGAGGFGQTFLAEDIHLPDNPRCVVKQLKPQFSSPQGLQTAKRLFDTEARVLAQLGDHDQIPRLLAHFEQNQEFYLAQELIIGEPLDTELRGDRQWSEIQVAALLIDILSTLAFVHQQGVIHRDIKPQNLIRRRRDGKIVLIDFGAVKQASVQLANPDSSPTRTISIGTQGYMPNEQIAGNPRFSSDVYAVGKIGIQALTGIAPRHLQEDPHTGEVQWRHLVPHVNAELADLLEQMIRYDFRTRFSTATEALVALQQLPIAPATDLNGSVVAVSNSDVSEPMLTTQAWANEPDATAVSENQLENHSENQAKNSLENPVAPTESESQYATLPLLPPQPDRNVENAHSRNARVPVEIRSAKTNWLKTKWVLLPLGGLVAVGLILAANLPRATQPEVQPQNSPVEASPAASATPDLAQQMTELLTQAKQQQQNNQFQKALELYDRAIALDAKSAEAQWGRCYSLNRLQRPSEAIQACDAALTLNPNYAEALWSKGYALDLQEQPQQALALYDRAISLKPDYAEAWSNKGTALYRLDRYEEALNALNKATQLNANLAEAWNSRGAVLWTLQQYDAAVASVDRALQIQPDYADARSLREQMRQRLGR